MQDRINNLIENSLFKLKGKITISQFRNIAKTFKWKLNYKKIQIVGTNGKGSVAKYLNDNLIRSGKKIGLFTSPHILNFEERIKINNTNIPFIDFQQYITNIYIAFPDYSFGFFQLIFLASLAYFEEKQVEVVIFEAGIGAKKDIVNYLDFDITIFTSISIDHEKILGSTIEKIAQDKSFAIKKKNKIFYPSTIEKSVQKILNNRVKLLDNESLDIINIESKNIHLQNQELSNYILEKEFLIKNNLFLMPTGRAQKIEINDISNFIDVAHNIDGIKKTLDYFKDENINFEQYIVSLSCDKNAKKIMKIFDKKITKVYQNKSDRALNIFDYPNEFEKLTSLKEMLEKLDKKTLFIGSFNFIEEILRLVKYDINSKNKKSF